MSRNGITYHDVARCAEALHVSHDEPTIERIRIQLKTGSNSTIGMHLRAWRAKQGSLQQLASKENIPEELVTLLKGLWERVMVQADSQVETIKNTAQQNFTDHQKMMQELQQNNAQLQQSEMKLKKACDSYAQEKIVLEQIISKSSVDITALQAKHDGLTQQLSDKQVRIDELHQQNKQTQANLEHYRTASLEQRQEDQQRAEQRERELTQALQQLSQENISLQQQTAGFQQSNDQLHSAHSDLKTRLDQATAQNENNVIELRELTTVLEKKTVSEQHWQTQHSTLGIKWEEQMKITAELQTQNAVLSQQITDMKIVLSDMTEQKKSLAHDKWILEQEKAQSVGQVKQLQSILTNIGSTHHVSL